MAFPAGIEPAAPSLGNLCSILLSYGNIELVNNIYSGVGFLTVFLRFRPSRTFKYAPVRFSKNRKNP